MNPASDTPTRTDHAGFLPTTRAEIDALGWKQPDVVFVSGDAYVDHPSFAAAILGRWLEHHGFKVAVLSQPDWRSADPWRQLGAPRLFYAVSAGAMDSMINHYTANRKRRNADAYSPGGEIGRRPDRANAVYAQRCREAFKGIPIVAGGVEASLRRVAHYDYWSDRVMPSSLVSSPRSRREHPRPAAPARRGLPARNERSARGRPHIRRRQRWEVGRAPESRRSIRGFHRLRTRDAAAAP
jgi:hypothetical protein